MVKTPHAGFIPGRGTKIPHAAWHGQNKKKNGDKDFGICGRFWELQRSYIANALNP